LRIADDAIADDAIADCELANADCDCCSLDRLVELWRL